MAAAYTKRERAMDVLWQRSHTLTEGLVTEEGARLRVLYPGTANHRAGPDFRGAVIATESGERILGDVELHISAPDWYSHGHQDDAGYNGVVLHVVLWPKGSTASRQRSGISTPIASIAGVSDTLKHAREQPPEGPVSGLESMDRDALAETLGRAGDERFRARSRGFEMELDSGNPDQVLYRALMESLGYASNRRPFLELAGRVPFASLVPLRGEPASTRAVAARAVLTAASGLLGCVRPAAEAKELRRLDAAYRRTCRSKSGAGRPYPQPHRRRPIALEQWALFRVRPSNHPVRRIAGAAVLVDRFLEAGPVRSLESGVRSGSPRSLAKRLEAPGSIGSGRSSDMVVNVVLPFFSAYAGLQRAGGLEERCSQLYRTCPKLADNESTREMKRILGPAAVKAAVTGAREQQGLIQLHREMTARPVSL